MEGVILLVVGFALAMYAGPVLWRFLILIMLRRRFVTKERASIAVIARVLEGEAMSQAEAFYHIASVPGLVIIRALNYGARRLATVCTRPCQKPERWLTSLCFWIPRKHREAIRGDILEDCHELRDQGFGEWRIRAHVLWQTAIAVVGLWPRVVGSAVAGVIRHLLSINK